MTIIPQFVGTNSHLIGLGLLIGIFAAFAHERYPPVVIAIGAAVIMLGLGFMLRSFVTMMKPKHSLDHNINLVT